MKAAARGSVESQEQVHSDWIEDQWKAEGCMEKFLWVSSMEGRIAKAAVGHRRLLKVEGACLAHFEVDLHLVVM